MCRFPIRVLRKTERDLAGDLTVQQEAAGTSHCATVEALAAAHARVGTACQDFFTGIAPLLEEMQEGSPSADAVSAGLQRGGAIIIGNFRDHLLLEGSVPHNALDVVRRICPNCELSLAWLPICRTCYPLASRPAMAHDIAIILGFEEGLAQNPTSQSGQAGVDNHASATEPRVAVIRSIVQMITALLLGVYCKGR